MSAVVENLQEKKPYYLRVAAVNEVGRGPFTELPEPVTPKCPHGQSLKPGCIHFRKTFISLL